MDLWSRILGRRTPVTASSGTAGPYRTPAPADPGWRALPPVQRALGGIHPAVQADGFTAGLATWRDPRMIGELEHGIGGTAGVVTGLVDTVDTAPAVGAPWLFPARVDPGPVAVQRAFVAPNGTSASAAVQRAADGTPGGSVVPGFGSAEPQADAPRPEDPDESAVQRSAAPALGSRPALGTHAPDPVSRTADRGLPWLPAAPTGSADPAPPAVQLLRLPLSPAADLPAPDPDGGPAHHTAVAAPVVLRDAVIPDAVDVAPDVVARTAAGAIPEPVTAPQPGPVPGTPADPAPAVAAQAGELSGSGAGAPLLGASAAAPAGIGSAAPPPSTSVPTVSRLADPVGPSVPGVQRRPGLGAPLPGRPSTRPMPSTPVTAAVPAPPLALPPPPAPAPSLEPAPATLSPATLSPATLSPAAPIPAALTPEAQLPPELVPPELIPPGSVPTPSPGADAPLVARIPADATPVPDPVQTAGAAATPVASDAELVPPPPGHPDPAPEPQGGVALLGERPLAPIAASAGPAVQRAATLPEVVPLRRPAPEPLDRVGGPPAAFGRVAGPADGRVSVQTLPAAPPRVVAPAAGPGSSTTGPAGAVAATDGSWADAGSVAVAAGVAHRDADGSVVFGPPAPAGGGSPAVQRLSLPSVPKPSWPSVPGLPSLPTAPALPSLPSTSGLPSLTDLPSMPGLPSLTDLPSAAGLPSVPNLPTPNLPTPGLPTGLPSMPGLPATPDLPSLPDLPGVPDALSLPTPPAPAAPGAPAAPAAPAGAAAPPALPSTDELVRTLFEPLAARLKAELRLDRERAGFVTDLRR